MATESSNAGEQGKPKEKSPMDLILEHINTRFDNTDANVAGIRNQVDGIAGSITVMQSGIERNRTDIGLLSNQLNAMKSNVPSVNAISTQVKDAVARELRSAGVGPGITDEWDKLIKNKLKDVDKEMDRAKAVATASALRPRAASTGHQRDERQAYWEARRCARISPIPGSGTELWTGAEDFFFSKMNIPRTELQHKHVTHVERVNAGRRSKIKDELLVVFANVRVRDMVASYASNLSAWKNASPPVNFRMEFPDHLAGVFRTLDNFGHVLKERLGKATKRNIKFDDVKHTLYMDICPENEKEWLRVDFELAQEEMALVKPRTASARSRLSSLGSTLGGPSRTPAASSTAASPCSAMFTSALSSQAWASGPSTTSSAPSEMETDSQAGSSWAGPPT